MVADQIRALAEEAKQRMLDFAEEVWQAGTEGFNTQTVAACREARASAEAAIDRLVDANDAAIRWGQIIPALEDLRAALAVQEALPAVGEPLTDAERDFLLTILKNPGGKIATFEWVDGPEQCWARFERDGLIECVGSWKWKPVDEMKLIRFLAGAPPVQAPASMTPAGLHLDIAAQGVRALIDSLMPNFEYVGVSLRVSPEDHAAIRSAMAGASTAVRLIEQAIEKLSAAQPQPPSPEQAQQSVQEPQNEFMTCPCGTFAKWKTCVAAPTHRHLKRGTLYTELHRGFLQTDVPLTDMMELVVYAGDDGKVWCRPVSEFDDDERFAVLAAPTSPALGAAPPVQGEPKENDQ